MILRYVFQAGEVLKWIAQRNNYRKTKVFPTETNHPRKITQRIRAAAFDDGEDGDVFGTS